jgi:hypothetical protein
VRYIHRSITTATAAEAALIISGKSLHIRNRHACVINYNRTGIYMYTAAKKTGPKSLPISYSHT